MKKVLSFLVAAISLVSCQKQFDEINNRLDNLEGRIKTIEEKCAQMNTDISSMKGAITALQNYNYVTEVTPLKENEVVIGYTISFSKGDDITIYHGNDGHTPAVGVKMDENEVYYWVVDNEWVLDAEGNKVPATGTTPELKIVNGNWQISYDNGQTWTDLGKATGENGDSFFSSVQTDADNVYIYLKDGNHITIPLAKIDYIQNLRSLTYIPRYDDGKALVISTSKEASFVDIDLEVSPKNAVPDIITYWSEHANAKAVNTITKSGSFIDMPILSVTGDVAEGIVTFKVSCKNLSDDFFAGSQAASVAVRITDGNYNVSSGYVPMALGAPRVDHSYAGKIKVIAHRGFWKANGSAQNSLKALREANKLNIWGCEVDVWETADNVLVVNHDGAINGVNIEYSPYSAIKDMTLSNGETLPTFEQYLKVFKEECSDLILIVEIKPHSGVKKTQAATRAAIDMIKSMNLEDDVEYISFSTVACDEVVKVAPTARVAYLESNLTPMECAVRGYASMDCTYTTYVSNPAWIEEAHALGMEVNTWTVNGRTDIANVYNMGIDMITTDRPDIVEGIVASL